MFEKRWQFDINHAYDTPTTASDMTKYALWYFKAFLCGQIGGATLGLWTVVGSSDSVTGGMDGLDRWGAAFDASKLVRAYSNVAHSWIVLRSPSIKGAYYYLLLEWKSSDDQNFSPQMSVGLPTGGSNTTPPTMPSPAAAPSSGTSTTITSGTNPGAMHLHAGLATDGSFFVLVSRDNAGKFISGHIGMWLGNAKPTDLYPFFFHSVGDGTLSTGYGGSNSYNLSTIGGGYMVAPDNSAAGSWAGVFPQTTNLPAGSDPFDSSYLDFPIFVGASTTAYRSLRGRLQDVAYFPGGAGTGTVDSTPGAPTYMVVGYQWFPTNQAPSL